MEKKGGKKESRRDRRKELSAVVLIINKGCIHLNTKSKGNLTFIEAEVRKQLEKRDVDWQKRVLNTTFPEKRLESRGFTAAGD